MSAPWPDSRAVAQPYWWPLPPLAGEPAPLETLVRGEIIETRHGAFFRRRITFPLDHRYGECRVGDFLAVDPQIVAVLAREPELAEVNLERMVFLDTETTGLAGGTGTHVFMVGLGYFSTPPGSAAFSQHSPASPGSSRALDRPQFVLDQLFMRGYGEERAMLAWLAEHLDRFEALATFNGRTFDVPLLQTRFVMSRMRVDLEERRHLDLLHPARRLWRAALPSCALQSLERHVLGVHRQDDVESFLIPAIYHQYLRDGDGRYLQRVFNHNVADILALVAIAVRACLALDAGLRRSPLPNRPPLDAGLRRAPLPNPPPAGECQGGSRPALSAAEFASLGRIFEQLEPSRSARSGAGQALSAAKEPVPSATREQALAAAERAYLTALEGSLPRELRCRTMMALAALYKRSGRYEEAAELWQALVDEAPAHSVAALVELAKYWEHRRKDLARAHALATLARERWRAQLPAQERSLPGVNRWPARPVELPDDFGRRLARLETKRARANGP